MDYREHSGAWKIEKVVANYFFDNVMYMGK